MGLPEAYVYEDLSVFWWRLDPKKKLKKLDKTQEAKERRNFWVEQGFISKTYIVLWR